jgi:hypothetical protein
VLLEERNVFSEVGGRIFHRLRIWGGGKRSRHDPRSKKDVGRRSHGGRKVLLKTAGIESLQHEIA